MKPTKQQIKEWLTKIAEHSLKTKEGRQKARIISHCLIGWTLKGEKK